MVFARTVMLDSNRAGLMHGSSARQKSSFMSMCSKDSLLHEEVMAEYLTHWKDKDTLEKAPTEKTAVTMVNKYVFRFAILQHY